MKSNVHSFSVRNAEDEELIKRIKLRVLKEGRSFSWYVVQSLKQAEETRNANK